MQETTTDAHGDKLKIQKLAKDIVDLKKRLHAETDNSTFVNQQNQDPVTSISVAPNGQSVPTPKD